MSYKLQQSFSFRLNDLLTDIHQTSLSVAQYYSEALISYSLFFIL
jgi:hypothetical protein